MIVSKTFDINGVSHVRHYSDSGLMIASDGGIEYEVAEDLTSLGKTYHETETPVESEPGEAEEILNILLGGDGT